MKLFVAIAVLAMVLAVDASVSSRVEAQAEATFGTDDIVAKEEFVVVRALENFICDMREMRTLNNIPSHLRGTYSSAEEAYAQLQTIYRSKDLRCSNPPINGALRPSFREQLPQAPVAQQQQQVARAPVPQAAVPQPQQRAAAPAVTPIRYAQPQAQPAYNSYYSTYAPLL